MLPLKKRQESLSHKGVKLALVNKKILPLKLLRNRDEDLLLAERTINEKIIISEPTRL